MTREKLLKEYKILRYNQRGGEVYFKVKKRGWFYWYVAYEWEYSWGDSYKTRLIFSSHQKVIDWINEDIKDRLSKYNQKVVTIDKFEPLVKKNIYLEELENLLEVI